MLIKLFVIVCLVASISSENSDDCGANPLACNSIKIIKNIVKQAIRSQGRDVELLDGVHLVESDGSGRKARYVGDDSLLGTVENYLESHELKIKLQDMLPAESVTTALKGAFDELSKRSLGK